MKRTLLFTLCLLAAGAGFSQHSLYEPREIQKAYDKGTRSRSGLPGDHYWQNTVSYDLKADFDPQSRILRGSGTIQYTNNSPDTLRYMVVKLLPNIHRKGGARDFNVGEDRLNDGMRIDSIAIDGTPNDINDQRRFREYGTNLYVILGRQGGLAPGSETEIFVSWHHEVVMHGIRNGAFTDSAFFIGYWYPQLAVYDDVYGWDREDYTGNQETYNEPGTYAVEINLPPDYVVWATGDQLNEKEVFAEQTLDRIKSSRNSSETIRILTSESYSGDGIFRDSHKGTWKFRAERVPDFAFACSNYYCWDANTLNLDAGEGKQVWINAVYPPDAVTFNRVADVAHQGIAYLSEVFPGIPYPFNKHISFNGIHHVAVEYPMMANNSDHASPEMYTELTVHEIAHNYIPFFMLSNERRHAWIDEGWVKLIGEMHGETLGVARADKESLNTMQVYERFAGTSDDVPLIVPSGFMTVTHNFYHSYAKAANADKFLLDLMAENGIDNPLKAFLLAWEGKHPTPYDFFYFMDGLIGEDLSWFWQPWYFNFSAPDLGIAATGEAGRVLITNHGGLPLPVKLTVVYDDKREQVIEKSIWEWSGGQQAIAVEIPDHEHADMVHLGAPEIPDIDEGNNVLVVGTFAD